MNKIKVSPKVAVMTWIEKLEFQPQHLLIISPIFRSALFPILSTI